MNSALPLWTTLWHARLGIAIEPSCFAGDLAIGRLARIFRPLQGSSLRSFHADCGMMSPHESVCKSATEGKHDCHNLDGGCHPRWDVGELKGQEFGMVGPTGYRHQSDTRSTVPRHRWNEAREGGASRSGGGHHEKMPGLCGSYPGRSEQMPLLRGGAKAVGWLAKDLVVRHE